jgi:hypothetical protein
MPAGVTQGKFTLAAGRAENGMGNAGLFRDVRVDRELATELDKRLLTTTSGPVNPDAFLSFVRRAVQEHWVESDRMNLTGRHDVRIPPPSEPDDTSNYTPAEPPAAPNATPLDPNANPAFPKVGR